MTEESLGSRQPPCATAPASEVYRRYKVDLLFLLPFVCRLIETLVEAFCIGVYYSSSDLVKK